MKRLLKVQTHKSNNMITKKEEQEKLKELRKEHIATYNEMIDLIIDRSGVDRKRLRRTAESNFAYNNIDLLTAAERKKYKDAISKWNKERL